MQSFRDLKVWEKSHQLALELYRQTRSFPREELYGLTSQIRRSGSSVPANIAEGCGRSSTGDFRRFLNIAMGSASEVEYHLLLARDLGYLKPESYQSLDSLTREVKRMLAGLIRKLSADSRQ